VEVERVPGRQSIDEKTSVRSKPISENDFKIMLVDRKLEEILYKESKNHESELLKVYPTEA
tara:strand:+ start:268 stop:450 length:183 start_codon:yes stop_codon:yes gene_type:complete